MSDSERSSSTESSSDSDDHREDFDETEIKLQQMRRKARAKAEATRGVGQERMKGLQSFEEMQQEHALKRTEKGLKDVLALHTPSELSSICGVLRLPVKQKGTDSTRYIIKSVSDNGIVQAERMLALLDLMWEGALFEYLRCVGHPIHSMFVDPRETVLKLWEEGGMLGVGTFIPHFVAREAKKRNEWVISPDIESRMTTLREMQEKVKHAEKVVLTGHDYNNILAYFKQMSDLRKYESDVREYTVSQLETARARLDSYTDTSRMMREDMAELERKTMTLAGAISDQLGYNEFVTEDLQNEVTDMNADLYRLGLIMDSYIEAEEDRSEAGGGTAQALSLRKPEESKLSIRKLHEKLQQYRNMRDETDETLRDRSRNHILEIDRLEDTVRDLEHQLEYALRRENSERERAEEAERDVRFCARKMMKMSNNKQTGMEEAWASSLRWQLKFTDQKYRNGEAKKLLLAGIQERENKLVQHLSYALIDVYHLASKEELAEAEESAQMMAADAFSTRYRKFLKKQGEGKKGPKKSVASSTPAKKDKPKKKDKDDDSKASSTKTAKSKASKGGGKDKKGKGKKKK